MGKTDLSLSDEDLLLILLYKEKEEEILSP